MLSTTQQAVNNTVQAIINVSQSVAALLGDPTAFTSTYANTLITTLELIEDNVRSLPLTTVQENEVLNVLNQAINLINLANEVGFIPIELVNSVLGLLQLAITKINAFTAGLSNQPIQRGCIRNFNNCCC